VTDWYLDWAEAHCTAFGFRDDAMRTVLAWRPVFGQLFTAADLLAATRHLLASPDAPRFAADHRAAIIRAVEAGRTAARRKATQADPPAGCEVCGGCGLVIVPHPGLADDGRWYKWLRMPKDDPRGLTRTAGVACVCVRGASTAAAAEAAGRPMLTLVRYEQHYPNHREVSFERAQVLAADRTARPTSADVEELKRRLARQTALPKAG
jgi:hypothetical protein